MWQADDNRPNLLHRRAPILNVWQERCEEVTTVVDELMLQTELYDDLPRCRELVRIVPENHAMRGFASLYVQANDMTLKEAGCFNTR